MERVTGDIIAESLAIFCNRQEFRYIGAISLRRRSSLKKGVDIAKNLEQMTELGKVPSWLTNASS